MDPLIERMCARYVNDSLIIPRSAESQALLKKLSIPTELGTDTAWTFEPHPPEYGRTVLRNAGWDGKTPILGLCPILPLFCPVKLSLPKSLPLPTPSPHNVHPSPTLYFNYSH